MRGGGREGGGTSYTFSCRLSSTGAGILETRQAEGATTPSHQNWWANNGRGLRKARLTPLRPQESDGSTWQVSTQFHCKPHRKVVRRMKDQRRTPFCPLTFVLQSFFCVCVGVGGGYPYTYKSTDGISPSGRKLSLLLRAIIGGGITSMGHNALIGRDNLVGQGEGENPHCYTKPRDKVASHT